MKLIDIEIAMADYLMPANVVVTNVSWGFGLHECDLLSVSGSRYLTETEIKISKSDLLKDANKRHGHVSDKIKYLYFAVPDYLRDIALAHIPERSGLMTVSEKGKPCLVKGKLAKSETKIVKVVKKPTANPNAKPLTDKELLNLYRLGCLKYWTVKRNLGKEKQKEILLLTTQNTQL